MTNYRGGRANAIRALGGQRWRTGGPLVLITCTGVGKREGGREEAGDQIEKREAELLCKTFFRQLLFLPVSLAAICKYIKFSVSPSSPAAKASG